MAMQQLLIELMVWTWISRLIIVIITILDQRISKIAISHLTFYTNATNYAFA